MVRNYMMSEAEISQGMPRIGSNHQKVARGKEGFPPLRGGWTALLTPWFWTSSFRKCETVNLLLKATQFVFLCYGIPWKPNIPLNCQFLRDQK